jgi:heme/copper-type cytochrome/quinol oxidase subunit 3
VSTAAADTAHLVEPAESPLTPESWGKLGMWNFLAADAMSFGGLLAAYGALRYGDPNWPKPSSILGITLTAAMTFLLVCSSVTMVESLAGFRSGNQAKLKKFLLFTILGGITFLGCQAYEWTHLIEHGQSIQRNNFGATFFILTGFHGMHVFSGVVYLSIILIRALLGKFENPHNNEIEIAALYWHFVDLIWILVFTFVYLV